ncbi:hypothetical protein BHE74_00018440 [Ensete ventricosum]|nr:hypothetical protein BHE74_00018440 [Ensete ventricosum]
MRLIPQGIRGNCHGTGEKTGRVMFASARIRFHIGTAVFRLVHSSSQLYNGDLWFRNPSASPPKHTSRTQTLPPLRSLYRRRTGSVRGPASPPLLPQAAGRRVRLQGVIGLFFVVRRSKDSLIRHLEMNAASAPSKLYSDDVSLIVVLLDVNPFFWASSAAAAGDSASSHHPTTTLAFSKLLNHVRPPNLCLNGEESHQDLKSNPQDSVFIRSSHCSIPFSSSTSSTRSSLLPPASTPAATSMTRETVKGGQQVVVCPPSAQRFFVGWRSLWSRIGFRGRAPIRWSPLVYLPCYLDLSLLHCAVSYDGFFLLFEMFFLFSCGCMVLDCGTDTQRVFRSRARHPQPRVSSTFYRFYACRVLQMDLNSMLLM